MTFAPATPYAIGLLIAAAISLAAGLAGLRRRGLSGIVVFGLLMLGLAEWESTSAIAAFTPDLPSKVLWAKIQYLGISSVPVLWLLLALRFTQRTIGPRRLLALLVVPLATVALASTNEAHHLIWSQVDLTETVIGTRARFSYGPAFWAAAVYNYALLALSTAALVGSLARIAPLYQAQTLLLLAGLALPWIANAAYLTRLAPLDLTPVGMTLSGLLCWWAFYRVRFLELAPVARDVAFVHSPDAALVLSARDQVVDVNPAAERLFGQPSQALIGRAGEALLGSATLVDEDGGRAVLRIGERTCEVQSVALRNQRGGATGRLVLLRDVTLQKQTEEALVAERDFARQVMDAMGQGLLVLDERGRCEYVNPMVADLLGMQPRHLLGRELLEFVAADDRLAVGHFGGLGASVRGGCDVRLLRPDGATVHALLTSVPVRRGGGEAAGWITVVTDLTERKQLEQALAHRAQHDPLTELPNRTLLRERLEQALARREHMRNSTAVLILDLDGFKAVNDSFGHRAGDELLQQLAARWRSVVRDGDTLARIGGDEFGLVLPSASDVASVTSIATRIMQAAAQPYDLQGGVQVSVGVSIGIALCPRDGHDAETLVRQADAAMYEAKRAGGGYVLATPAGRNAFGRSAASAPVVRDDVAGAHLRA
jgi:diguanylate cyclase (GGDEF)-like protein/PAS domain S-box-containing protein